jgi:hypothetical protein
MRWTDLTLLGGLLFGLAGIVLTVRQAGRRWWWAREQPARSTIRLEGIAELAGPTAIFGGLAMMQLGNVAEHVSKRTLPPDPWLSLASGVAVLLVFGVQLGRLLMRWQLRRLGAVLDTESGEFTPRPFEN